jgi:thiamine biosynthesis lipoprotein
MSSCSKPSHQVVQQQLFTFGTLVTISIWTDKPDQANLLIQQLSADFETQHIQWHPSNQESLLAKINQQIQTGETAKINPSLVELINLAIIYSKQSENLFNPAIGQLVDLWHFDQVVADQHEVTKPPSEKKIQSLLALKPLMSDLVLNKRQLLSSNRSVKLDLGAFAKGYAVDLAIKSIKDAGFKNALVNAGGDIKALGSKGGKAWKIGIRNPFYQQQIEIPVLASMELKDNESIMTSGDYERYFNYQGKHYHHIIDPRNGYPTNGFHSVTVVHSDAALADAAATAIFIAGKESWKQIAKNMGVDKIMLINQQQEILMTKNLQDRISFINKAAIKKIKLIELELKLE